jgi:Oxidoreductase molybdopterin binding domain
VERRNVGGASGTTGESTRRLTGVLPRDVLDAASLVELRRGDLRHRYVVASASDGYSVVFSWGELFNAPIGDGALVVYEQDGAPLPDSEGKIALVSVNDKGPGPGPRHAKWLKRIEMRIAGE